MPEPSVATHGVPPVGFYLHPAAALHDTGWGHPEHQGRLRSLASTVGRDLLALHGKVEQFEAEACGLDPLLRVHEAGLLEYVQAEVEQAQEEGNVRILADGETRVSPASWDAATGSVGAILEGARKVAAGSLSAAFVAARPPGHHATPDRAMGFCLVNGVAVAARMLQDEGWARRVLVVDWDVHHGNGTQDIFYADPSVFFLSLHQAPLWPGTGLAEERGEGPGEGATLNIPVPPGFPREAYLQRFREALGEVEARFQPDFVLVSSGFDALESDPLGGLLLQPRDYHTMTREVLALARRHCGGKVVAVLEGGYDPRASGQAAVQVIRALAGVDPAQDDTSQEGSE